MLGTGIRGLLLVLATVSAGCNMSDFESRPQARKGLAPQAQPGDVAPDYISGDRYPSLLVEVDFIEGNEPSTEALGRMRSIFQQRIEKPLGIEYIVDSKIPITQSKTRYEVGDILALEHQYRRNHTDDAANKAQAVIWIVYLNGDSEFDDGSSRALGISYDASSIAVFKENIERTSAPEVRDVVEAIVLVHEGGHLFGLVNNGIPMANPHEDPAHPRHDASRDCVMYHRIETMDAARLLTEPPLDFDYACRVDMYAAGGLDPGAPPEGQPYPAPITGTAVTEPPAPRTGGPLLGRALVPITAPAR
jgi:hypothetical protein